MKVFPRGHHGLPAVLFVESSLRENGGLRVSLEHARRLRAAGAPSEVAVVQVVSDGVVVQPDGSLPVHLLSRHGERLRHIYPRALLRLVRLARKADVVVAGSEIGSCLLLGFVAARVAHRPFAVLVQADLDDAIAEWVPGPLRRVTRWVHGRVDAALCVSDGVAASVVSAGLPGDRVHVVPNGIDVATIRVRAGLAPLDAKGRAPGRPTAPHPSGRSVPMIVANGRLSRAKNIPLLLRAHHRALSDGVAHQLTVMGEGPDRPALEALIDELGLTGSVSLPGFVEEPYGIIATADLFVLSSDTEGLPLTLLEALAVGAPIVSTRCGSGPDVLLDGGAYGRLVPVGSIVDLAAAIVDHLERPGDLRALALGGPGRAMEFDAGISAARILALLTTLADDGPGQRRSAGITRRAVPA